MDFSRFVIIFVFGVFLGLNASALHDFFTCEENDVSIADKVLEFFGMKQSAFRCKTTEELLIEMVRRWISLTSVVLIILAMRAVKSWIRSKQNSRNRGDPKPIWVTGSKTVSEELSAYTLDVTAIGKIKVSLLYGKRYGRLLVLIEDDD